MLSFKREFDVSYSLRFRIRYMLYSFLQFIHSLGDNGGRLPVKGSLSLGHLRRGKKRYKKKKSSWGNEIREKALSS